MHSDDIRNRHIANLYEAGFSSNQIAARLGISREKVRRTLVNLGIPRRPRGWPHKRRLDHDAVVAAFINGKTRQEIAADWNTNRGVINRILRENGWYGGPGTEYRASAPRLEAAE